MQDFHKIRRLPPYVFEQVNQLKQSERIKGTDIIDLGMGNPDLPTPQLIVDKLCEIAQDPRTHRYSVSRGIAGLRKAQAAYYEDRFGVKLNPETQVISTLGSKEGFANMAQAITAPGDVILVPNPSYPIHAFGFIMSGGVIRNIPVKPDENFFQVLGTAVKHSIPSPTALILNYPSNPTAEIASIDFYKDVVTFARRHDIILLSDLAYAEIYFGGKPPPSIFEIPGSIDIAVEFTSMSKTFSMPGWRIGFAVGNEKLISALARVKSYLDYGSFTPIQVAAIYALNNHECLSHEVRKIYQRRRDIMISSFSHAGWEILPPAATMFAWAKIPPAFQKMGSLEFSKLLLENAAIAVSPGIGFGEYGDGYVRIAIVENENRIRQAAKNLKQFLANKKQTI